jgi:hypothetical protein
MLDACSCLFVGHGTRIALATACRLFVHAFTAGVSVLAAPLLLATGHGRVFAAALHVATSVCGLVGILGVNSEARRGHGQGRSHRESHKECLDFSHLCISILRELRCAIQKRSK